MTAPRKFTPGHALKKHRPPRWVAPFLAALAAAPNVSAAASAAGIGRRAAYKHRAKDAEFASEWDEALEQSTDELVGECYRRAVHGVEKPVFHKGEVCGHIKEYSDTLAIFLAKAHRPKVYRDRTEHTIEVPAVHPSIEAALLKVYGPDSVPTGPELDALGGIAAKVAGIEPKTPDHA